jgi:hypothetical protein
MRPWFAIDRYTDVDGNGSYNAPPDTYTSPGYTAANIGMTVSFHNNLSPSGFGQVDVGAGGNAIRNAIEYCVDNSTYAIGQSIPTKPGGTTGPERQGVNEVMAWDPGAYWDPSSHSVQGSCAPACDCSSAGSACPNGGRESPRIFVVAVCSPTEAACAAGGPANSHVTITNFLSFLLMGESGGGNNLTITAVLIGSGGINVPTAPGPTAPFLTTIQLIR